MDLDYPSPSCSQSALTDPAGSNQGAQHDPRQVTRSGPSQRKRMPKRFDFIPEDRQKELFPMYGERVIDYKRQMVPKSNGPSNKRQSRKRRTKRLRQAEAAHEPTLISPTTSNSISESQQSKSWEVRNATDLVNHSSSAKSVSTFSTSQEISYGARRIHQGHGHNSLTSYNPPAGGPHDPFPTSFAYAANPYIMGSYQVAEPTTPYSHQYLDNAQLTHPTPGHNSFDPPRPDCLQPGTSGPPANRLCQNMEPPHTLGFSSPSNGTWNTVSPLYNDKLGPQEHDSYMLSSTTYQNLRLHDQQEAESHGHLWLQQMPQSSLDSPFNPSNYFNYR